MRNLAFEPTPMLVHAPAQGGYPGGTALYQDYAQARETLEDAFHHHAGGEALHRLYVRVMLFEIVGDPSGCCGRMAARPADMKRDRNIVPFRRLVDGPVATASQRFGRARRQQHLDEFRMVGPPLDFGN